jgi:3-oxoacyl-[acyl-carrier protein] reductase
MRGVPHKPGPIGDWDTFQVGYEASIERTISETDIEAFAALTGDRNPLHLDVVFAQRTPFGRPIAHGMLSASFVSTVIGMLLPGPGALWTEFSIRFVRPAYAGDTLTVSLRVRRRSQATRTLVLDVAVTGPRTEEIITGEATVRVLIPEPERTDGEPVTMGAVLVSGGGRGLGAAIANRLAREGYPVAVNYRMDAAAATALVAEIVAGGGRAVALQADVTNEPAVTDLVQSAEEAIGPIESVVHCAAEASALVAFGDLPWAAVSAQVETQIHGAFNLVQATLPGMRDRGMGRFIFIGSVAADGVPPSHQADYVVAKSALVAMARSIAVDHGPEGITANVVAPGMTNTGISLAMPEMARAVARMQSPLRRLTEPDDVADMVAFLLSPAARQLTGQTIRVAGGSSMA